MIKMEEQSQRHTVEISIAQLIGGRDLRTSGGGRRRPRGKKRGSKKKEGFHPPLKTSGEKGGSLRN